MHWLAPVPRRLGPVLLAALLLASSTLAAEADDFQLLLRHTGLPDSMHPPPGQPLTPDKARALWRGLVDSPATPRTFAPRTVLARLLNEPLSSGQPLSRAELLSRTRRFQRLVVVCPDGYASRALDGTPLARLGPPSLHQGELYVQSMRVGAFHFDNGGVFYAVDESLRKHGRPVGERPLGRDPLTAALLGTEDALAEMAQGLATLLTEPVRTLEGLRHLPSAVGGLLASSPEYFSRYGAMNLEDQVREAARLATHVLTLQGGASTVGPRLASTARLPVLSVSSQGTLVVRELAVSAGSATAVVGAGAASASIVLLSQADDPGGGGPSPGRWPPPPEGPGEWTPKREHMPGKSQRYQSQVTGAPEGWVYRVRTGPGPKDFVDFDGFKNGALKEIKGPGYRELLEKMHGKDWFKGLDSMVKQAARQLDAARGTPIQWHFAEKEVADAVRQLFKTEGLEAIEVLYSPPLPS
jgi:hypothetical protein